MPKKGYRTVEFFETGDWNVISTLPLLVIFVFSAPCFLLLFFGINEFVPLSWFANRRDYFPKGFKDQKYINYVHFQRILQRTAELLQNLLCNNWYSHRRPEGNLQTRMGQTAQINKRRMERRAAEWNGLLQRRVCPKPKKKCTSFNHNAKRKHRRMGLHNAFLRHSFLRLCWAQS